jgi:hypothetical protein
MKIGGLAQMIFESWLWFGCKQRYTKPQVLSWSYLWMIDWYALSLVDAPGNCFHVNGELFINT